MSACSTSSRATPEATRCRRQAHATSTQHHAFSKGRHIRTPSAHPPLAPQRCLDDPVRLQRSVQAHASSLLSTYPLPLLDRTPAQQSSWLVAGVKHILAGQQLNGHPKLLLVHTRPFLSFKALPVSAAAGEQAEVWSEVRQAVRSEAADALLLLRPISSPDSYCALAQHGTPCTAHSHQATSTSTHTSSPALRLPAPRPPVLDLLCREVSSVEGKVGDCCNGSSEEGHTSHSHHHSHTAQPHQPSDTQQQQRHHQLQQVETQYYGLVAQSGVWGDHDGCYVLKTSRSADPTGCSCTHFSLTPVCRGQPMYEQLRDSWLTPASSSVQ